MICPIKQAAMMIKDVALPTETNKCDTTDCAWWSKAWGMCCLPLIARMLVSIAKRD